MIERRAWLKLAAAGVVSPAVRALAGVQPCHLVAIASNPPSYQLQFFTPAENALVDEWMEMIIPTDAHSRGARAARVSLFADLILATSDAETQQAWRRGLALMRDAAQQSSNALALAKAAAGEAAPQTELHHFFHRLKQMTVDGYYTSEIGIHEDLQYQGNTYLSEFPGCTHPEHQ